MGIILKIKGSRIPAVFFSSDMSVWLKGYIFVDRNRVEKHLYYGLAILAVLFVIVGLTRALWGYREKETEVMKEQTIFPEKETEEETAAEAEAENSSIRVLLMTDGHRNTVHPGVTLSSDSGFVVSYGEETEECESGAELSIAPDDVRFEKGIIRIQAKEGKVTIKSMNRGYGNPSYEGVIELRTSAEGVIVINELPLESYLCGVVPSEMPAAYELEALKAQAVCARSYAYQHVKDYAYPEYEAHVDDSETYQVYNNSKPRDSAAQAVSDTAGEVVRLNGEVVSTYYYSTSCGKTTSVQAWGTKESEANCYLQSVDVKGEEGDYEKELPWYRWEADVPIQTMSNLVGLNTGVDVGTLDSIEVVEAGPGGVALKIEAKGSKGSVTVETENKIRRALGGEGYIIRTQDGAETDSRALLPSAFFTVEKAGDLFVIKGGGFGHGIGMSQNGANEMAKCGKNYKEILTLFYQGVTVGP